MYTQKRRTPDFDFQGGGWEHGAKNRTSLPAGKNVDVFLIQSANYCSFGAAGMSEAAVK